MINLAVVRVIDSGACNFCNRGILNESEPGLIYPYTVVYEVSADVNMSPSVRFCSVCMEELKQSANFKLK